MHTEESTTGVSLIQVPDVLQCQLVLLQPHLVDAILNLLFATLIWQVCLGLSRWNRNSHRNKQYMLLLMLCASGLATRDAVPSRTCCSGHRPQQGSQSRLTTPDAVPSRTCYSTWRAQKNLLLAALSSAGLNPGSPLGMSSPTGLATRGAVYGGKSQPISACHSLCFSF